MTIDQARKLTKKKLRMMIAETLGAKWKCLYAASHATLTFRKDGSEPNWTWCQKDKHTPIDEKTIMDYPNSLDAMYLAEEFLIQHPNKDLWSDYCEFLSAPGIRDSSYSRIHASARQRAEAFVLTIN